MDCPRINHAANMGKPIVSEGFCNGCTLCCKSDAVRLLPEDDLNLYETEPHPYFHGHLVLAHKENGDCLYLTESGCSIHDHSPIMCKEMDCRNLARMMTKKQAKQLEVGIAVWNRGRQLIGRAW